VEGRDLVRIPPRPPLLLLRSTHTPAFREEQYVLGTTWRTKAEIEVFDEEFERKYRKYRGLTVNCQFYVRALFDFLMEKGEKNLDLPPPESIGSWFGWKGEQNDKTE
jgi:hypothetical protein